MSRSSSMANPASEELIERNRNLELKLRYVQSVNTIFRQRVGVVMQGLTAKVVELQAAAGASPSGVAASVSSLFAVGDDASTNSDTSPVNAEVSYWQDRFVDAMSNVQPISQSEVETLCRLIRDKVNRDNGTGVAASPGAAHGSPSGAHAAHAHATELSELREHLAQSEARNKSLFHRISDLRRREAAAAAATSDQNVTLTGEVATLAGTVRELRARLAEQEALNRRLGGELAVLRSDKQLQMQHLSRMQGMCAAVMRESQCAVNEGLAATQMNETALLKRQMDTFELVLRKTEQDLTVAKRRAEEKDALLAEKDRELMSLQMRLDSKEKTLELYRARCDAMATSEKEQREEQVRSMSSLRGRLGEAVGELEGAYTSKSIAAGLDKVQAETSKFAASRSSGDALHAQLETLRKQYAALSEELTLCAKQGRVPRTQVIAAESARVLVGQAQFPREAVLRTDGAWREMRDLNEGSVFYVTTAIANTPFDPARLSGAAAPVAPAAAPPSPVAASSPKAAAAAASPKAQAIPTPPRDAPLEPPSPPPAATGDISPRAESLPSAGDGDARPSSPLTAPDDATADA